MFAIIVMMIQPGTYRHSKSGNEYKVLGVGKHSETLEDVVIYQGQYDSEEFGPNPLWCRPVEMWQEAVEIDGEMVPRFVRIS
jgi:hypothetical protein